MENFNDQTTDKYAKLWALPTPSKENDYQYPAMKAVIADIATEVIQKGKFTGFVNFKDTNSDLFFNCNRHRFQLETVDGHTYFRVNRRVITGNILERDTPNTNRIGVDAMIVTLQKQKDGSRLRHPNFHARATFPYIINYFDYIHPDAPVTVFKAQWVRQDDGSPGDNLHSFYSFVKQEGNYHSIETFIKAAKNTPSGKIALHAGFDKQVIVNATDTEVIAYFMK